MNDIGQYFREEWEALILAGVALLLLLGLGAHFLDPPARKRRGFGGGENVSYKRMFQDQEFAALQSDTTLQLSRSPFAFTIEGGKPSTPPDPPPTAPAPAVAPDPPTAEPAVEQAPDGPTVATPSAAPPAAEGTRPRLQFRPQRISYLFFGQDDKGQTTAMLKVQLQGKAPEILTLAPGDRQSGISILSIRDNAVRLRDARGREVTIQYGEHRVVTALVEGE